MVILYIIVTDILCNENDENYLFIRVIVSRYMYFIGTLIYVRNITSETILVDMVFVVFLFSFGISILMVLKNIRVSGNNDHLIIDKEDGSMQIYERYIPTHRAAHFCHFYNI